MSSSSSRSIARKQLFGGEHVNVQPHSGAQANMAVYFAAIKPGDRILTMNLAHGGHLTHGHPANFSGKFYEVTQYGVSEKTEQIDYDALAQTGRGSAAGDDHRRRFGVSAIHRFSAAAPDRRFGRCAAFHRHGAHRGTGRRRRTSEPGAARALCHHDDAQEPARTARRDRDLPGAIRESDRLVCFPRRARRTAHARDRGQGGLFPRSASAAVPRISATGGR